MRHNQTFSLGRSSHISWPSKGFPHFLLPINLHFLSYNKLMVTLLHTTMEPFPPCMNTWIHQIPQQPSAWSPHPLPPITHNRLHALPCLPSRLHILINIYRTPTPNPMPMILQFPGPHYTINTSPWILPLLTLQGNIVIHVSSFSTLWMTDGNTN